MKLFRWKSRKYPIKYDEYGLSARQQAFSLFRQGYRPAQIDKQEMVPVSLKTLFRYFEDWKRGKHLISYPILRKLMREDPEITKEVITLLSGNLEMSIEEVVLRMQRPWGLLQLMKGEWPNYKLKRTQRAIENRLEAALRLVLFVEQVGGKKPEMVKELVERLITAPVSGDDGMESKITS